VLLFDIETSLKRTKMSYYRLPKVISTQKWQNLWP